jgi:hypothetical protein
MSRQDAYGGTEPTHVDLFTPRTFLDYGRKRTTNVHFSVTDVLDLHEAAGRTHVTAYRCSGRRALYNSDPCFSPHARCYTLLTL